MIHILTCNYINIKCEIKTKTPTLYEPYLFSKEVLLTSPFLKFVIKCDIHENNYFDKFDKKDL